MVNAAAVLEQLPALEKVTGLPEAPPVPATEKLVPNTALAGACVVTVIAWAAFCALTVSTTCGAAVWFASPAWSYFTVQVPVPLVIVNVAPVFEQLPALENVTGPPGAVAATVNCALNAALAGAWVVTVIVWSARATVSEPEPVLGSKPVSPANEAPTPV